MVQGDPKYLIPFRRLVIVTLHCSILNINIPTKTRDFQVLLYIIVILID